MFSASDYTKMSPRICIWLAYVYVLMFLLDIIYLQIEKGNWKDHLFLLILKGILVTGKLKNYKF